MMNTLRMLVAVTMVAVAPALAGEAKQVWQCEIDDEATEEQVAESAREWLAAARKMPGGKNFKLSVHFPIAVNATGEHDMIIVVTAPSLKEWGEFWDGYPDSPAAAIEEDCHELFVCPNSTLWESIQIKTGEQPETKGTAGKAPGKAVQMWSCELDDDATEEEVAESAQEWLAAARKMPGGQNFELYVHFPVAVNATGEHDMRLVVVAPTFKEWGEFWDGYPDSPAAAIEEDCHELFVCPNSTLWEAIKVE